MGLFDEICERHQKFQLQVELDLRYALKLNARKKNWDEEYYADLRKLLEEQGFIEFVPYKYIPTKKGERSIKRGWVIKRAIRLILPSVKVLFHFFRG